MEWVQSALGSLRSKFAPENPLKTPVQPSAGMKRMNERTSQEHPMLPFARDTMNMVFPGVGNVFSPLTNRALHAMDIQDEVAYEAGARTQDALDFLPSPLPEIAATGVYTAGNVFDPVPGPNPAMVSWHGTPGIWLKEPRFPRGRPRLDKVNTGEGSQMQGWGFYSADMKDVGEHYMQIPASGFAYEALRELGIKMDSPATYELPDMLLDAEGDLRRVVNQMNQQIVGKWRRNDSDRLLYESIRDKLSAAIDAGVEVIDIPKGGSLYAIDIPDDDAIKYLEYDVPLSQQPEHVKRALDKMRTEYGFEFPFFARQDSNGTWNVVGPQGKVYLDGKGEPTKEAAEEAARQFRNGWEASAGGKFHDEATGRNLYDAVVILMADGVLTPTDPENFTKSASLFFRDLDIPGLKYFDQLSRAKKEGTRNYVTWDQRLLDRSTVLKSGEDF